MANKRKPDSERKVPLSGWSMSQRLIDTIIELAEASDMNRSILLEEIVEYYLDERNIDYFIERQSAELNLSQQMLDKRRNVLKNFIGKYNEMKVSGKVRPRSRMTGVNADLYSFDKEKVVVGGMNES